ncbi:MAG: UDP-N-acetylglucosamine 2-epimerase (non-hydrolyzing) [Acidobacteriota bacterium]
MKKPKIVTIVGTRPEIIKMAPVIKELDRRRDAFDHTLVATAQHREMLDQFLSAFDIHPEIDLNLMQQGQSLAHFASRSLASLFDLLKELKPDAALIQGDTTTVMTAGLAAFYLGIKVGHVEAGLRSFDQRNPFPEEVNRRITSCVADWHFAPTVQAHLNLLGEGVMEESIFITGNTIVDALQSISLDGEFENETLRRIDFTLARALIVTAHRRESHGSPLRSICRAVKTVARSFDDVEIIFPVHLNEQVSSIVREELEGEPRIHLLAPLSYFDMLRAMSQCRFALTDSGGIQEEAPSFSKPVLVLREVTERPELIECGAGLIVGTDRARIVEAASLLLNDEQAYAKMASAKNPFGDGRAALRICDIVERQLAGE